MPITSKKQSQAKQDWLKNNSKVYGVRVMNNENEKDIWDFLQAQDAPATTIKKALREYMENHKDECQQAHEVYPCDLDMMGECPKHFQDCANCKMENHKEET